MIADSFLVHFCIGLAVFAALRPCPPLALWAALLAGVSIEAVQCCAAGIPELDALAGDFEFRDIVFTLGGAAFGRVVGNHHPTPCPGR